VLPAELNFAHAVVEFVDLRAERADRRIERGGFRVERGDFRVELVKPLFNGGHPIGQRAFSFRRTPLARPVDGFVDALQVVENLPDSLVFMTRSRCEGHAIQALRG